MPGIEVDQTLADRMVNRAVAFSAQRRFAGDVQQALMALRQGQCEICGYATGSLVSQVGEVLGELDRTVKAVFQYEAEDIQGRTGWRDLLVHPSQAGINLVVWVERKNAALLALGSTLQAALAESRRKIGCKNASAGCYTLDIQMVDDRDIQEGRGFGLMIPNRFLRVAPVWRRESLAVGSTPATADLQVILNPELAPEEVIFEHALAIEKMPLEMLQDLEPHLREAKVVLIRRLISDQLAYIHIAKEWFSIADLYDIHERRIGNGRVGGKAAGLLLASRILREISDEAFQSSLMIPASYFIGSDLIYIFMAMNGLMHWNNQKYKSEKNIREEYGRIREEFQAGVFPPEIMARFKVILEQVGRQPIIVRSSSQLEDNFGTSFAGKYDSYFCPNQDGEEENLAALTQAVARTYASTLKPEALLYRRYKGLQDYDERMSVILQVVQGERFGRYYLPFGAGVAFSRNLYRWTPQIRREDGFARLVWGLGTRAVERVGNDYPRLVALSHPTLQPDDDPRSIRYYSQQYVDVIDLEENCFKTLPVGEVISPDYPPLRYLAQVEQDGYFTTPRGRVLEEDIRKTAITYDELLRRTPFPAILKRILSTLEEKYCVPVDVEFTVHVPEPSIYPPKVKVTLLQCRPQSHLHATGPVKLPENLEPQKIIFNTHFLVPQGYLDNIRAVLFTAPEAYFSLSTQAERNELSRAIAAVNAALAPKSFICVGPGRWGTNNPDLGIYVIYADIYNAGSLIEISGRGIGVAPEPSLGTHFFQDLMEAQIYPLAINLDDAGSIFNHKFFYETPNHLREYVQTGAAVETALRLIEVADFVPHHHIELMMDDESSQAVAYLAPDV